MAGCCQEKSTSITRFQPEFPVSSITSPHHFPARHPYHLTKSHPAVEPGGDDCCLNENCGYKACQNSNSSDAGDAVPSMIVVMGEFLREKSIHRHFFSERIRMSKIWVSAKITKIVRNTKMCSGDLQEIIYKNLIGFLVAV